MLQEFISIVRNRGLHNRALYYFELEIPFGLQSEFYPDTQADSKRTVSLFCNQTNIPGHNFLTNDQNRDIVQRRKFVYDYDFSDLNCSFYVDQNFQVRRLFDAWKNLIVNRNFTVGYFDDYKTEARITVINKLHENIAAYRFIDLAPKTISDTSLAWSGGNDITTQEVTFTFTKVEPIFYSGPYEIVNSDNQPIAETNPYIQIATDVLSKFNTNQLFNLL